MLLLKQICQKKKQQFLKFYLNICRKPNYQSHYGFSHCLASVRFSLATWHLVRLQNLNQHQLRDVYSLNQSILFSTIVSVPSLRKKNKESFRKKHSTIITSTSRKTFQKINSKRKQTRSKIKKDHYQLKRKWETWSRSRLILYQKRRRKLEVIMKTIIIVWFAVKRMIIHLRKIGLSVINVCPECEWEVHKRWKHIQRFCLCYFVISYGNYYYHYHHLTLCSELPHSLLEIPYTKGFDLTLKSGFIIGFYQNRQSLFRLLYWFWCIRILA